MTVIAWDGRTLAADKRASNAGMAKTVRKIDRHGDVLFAVTGDFDTAAELREWFKAGAKPSEFPEAARKDAATLVVIDAQGIRSYATGPYPMPIEDRISAWGSGRDFAMAVMHLGFDARKAVEVACLFQTDCGNGIDCLELESST